MLSKVYFTDMSTSPEMGLLKKLELLLKKVGLEKVIEPDHLVAVKLHFGEYGNLSHIRPQYARVVVDYIKRFKGKPFLTDANTLYKGHRSNAVDHILNAYLNGFTPEVVGAPVIIADGLRGSDEVEIKIDGEYVKEAKVGAAVALADTLVVLTHFKGHEQTGFGGALKNVGMGAASRIGKLEQHSDSKPYVREENCVACRMCEKHCPENAIIVEKVAKIDYEKCVGCGECIAMCIYGAMSPKWSSSAEILSKKIAEYALAAVKGKKAIFISFLTQISPDCDCWHINKPPVVSDIGFAASSDPVALDQACIDLVLQKAGKDPFLEVHPSVNWKIQLEHAERIGLGSRAYDLVKVACDL
ncbi:MAG: 4Fe-4S ferredoxin [Thermotogae bacterium]|nr:MAG: 4Fe-4S ferredoxin [Thermotogota bacterium]